MLAVGDAAFQQKCFEQFEQLKREGKTIVLVTHDMSAVERFCHRAMLIERGDVLEIGDAARDRARATTSSTSAGSIARADARTAATATTPPPRSRTPGSRTTRGERIKDAGAGRSRCTMCMEVRFHAAVDDPIFAFNLLNEPRHTVFATSSDWRDGPSGHFAAGETASRSACASTTGSRRSATRSARRSRAPGTGADALDLREDLAALVVHGTRVTGGIADVPHEYSVERA